MTIYRAGGASINSGTAYVAGAAGGLLIPRTITSDTASGGNTSNIDGRFTDAGLDGVSKIWSTGAGNRAIAISSGQFVQGTGSTANTYAFDAGVGNMLVTAQVNSLTTSTLQILARQASALGTVTFYTALLNASGNALTLRKTVGGSTTDLATGLTWAAGDFIGILCYGTSIQLWKNGAPIASVRDSGISSTNTMAGFRPSATAVFAVDNLVVTDPTLNTISTISVNT